MWIKLTTDLLQIYYTNQPTYYTHIVFVSNVSHGQEGFKEFNFTDNFQIYNISDRSGKKFKHAFLLNHNQNKMSFFVCKLPKTEKSDHYVLYMKFTSPILLLFFAKKTTLGSTTVTTHTHTLHQLVKVVVAAAANDDNDDHHDAPISGLVLPVVLVLENMNRKIKV